MSGCPGERGSPAHPLVTIFVLCLNVCRNRGGYCLGPDLSSVKRIAEGAYSALEVVEVELKLDKDALDPSVRPETSCCDRG